MFHKTRANFENINLVKRKMKEEEKKFRKYATRKREKKKLYYEHSHSMVFNVLRDSCSFAVIFFFCRTIYTL